MMIARVLRGVQWGVCLGAAAYRLRKAGYSCCVGRPRLHSRETWRAAHGSVETPS